MCGSIQGDQGDWPVIYEIQDESGAMETACMKDLKHFWSTNPNLFNENISLQLGDHTPEREVPKVLSR